MTKPARIQMWFGPVLLLLSAFAWFGERQYAAWSAEPAPVPTWGCGAANVMPAGVHLPEKAAFNWWLLAAQMLLALLVLLLAGLIWVAVRLVAKATFVKAPVQIVDCFRTDIEFQPEKLFSNFVLTNFGMRAPPVVVFA